MAIIAGKIHKVPSGSAYLIRENQSGNIFIPASRLNGAMNGDLVEVESMRNSYTNRITFSVKNIIERASSEVVGRYDEYSGNSYIIPIIGSGIDDVSVPSWGTLDAEENDMVAGRIINYPESDRPAEAEIREIIAKDGDPSGIASAILRSNGLNKEFPAEIEHFEASSISSNGIPDETLSARRDLRDETVITIDGNDTRDLDDAVSVRKLENGNYLLGVHIADVSHFVESGTALDKEALKRGTSFYMVSQVIPMLPETLSTDTCSLNEGVDRLTLTCEIEIDSAGSIVRHDIFESCINSKARLTYDDASDMIENSDADLIAKYSDYNGSDIYSTLNDMRDLAQILNAKRLETGCIEFEFPESKIILDENWAPVDVKSINRRTAEKMVQEFMLVANAVVAEHFSALGIPFIFRSNDKPDDEALADYDNSLKYYDLSLGGNYASIEPKSIQDILNQAKGRPCEKTVTALTLRLMSKAYYSGKCGGHFGQAFKYYCQWTSPIRRYTDLVNHRIIKDYLEGKAPADLNAKYSNDIPAYTQSCTFAEMKAQSVERIIEKLKKAEYMNEHIGEEYDAEISGFSDDYITVTLPNTVEGDISLDSFTDDYYSFDKECYRVIGEDHGNIFTVGMPVKVKVDYADTESGYIDLTLLDY